MKSLPQYHLQPYTNISSRTECPACHDRHSFVLYVDEQGTPIDATCGRCNHESSCGYHYPPKQYFADHPQETRTTTADNWKRNDWRLQASPMRLTAQPRARPLCTIATELVTRSQSYRHNLAFFLMRLFRSRGEEKAPLQNILDAYRVGATKDRRTIFWQIDAQGRTRTGKIMAYSETTGHRQGSPTWTHALLKRQGTLTADWQLSQCLFGEHLLNIPDNKTKPVALVESEKTALIAAVLYPACVWLATGGCGNLKAETARVLTGRNVIVFPDTGSFDKWKEIVSGFSFAHFRVSDILEGKNYPTNYDIADLLISNLTASTIEAPQLSPALRSLLDMEARNPALHTLVERLQLEVVE